MDDKKRVGFLGTLKNMFVGVAKPEAYYRNGRFGRMSSAMLITFIMSTLTYLVIFFIPYNQLFGGGRLADRIDRNWRIFYCPEMVFTTMGHSTGRMMRTCPT